MKVRHTCKLLLLLSALITAVVAPVFATSTFAADQAVPSKWAGVYEGLSRGCSGQPLVVNESTISWTDCKRVKVRVGAVSDVELLLEVNREAKCGWAGWLVSLRIPSAERQAVEVTTYQSLEKYREKEYGLFCVYSKKSSD